MAIVELSLNENGDIRSGGPKFKPPPLQNLICQLSNPSRYRSIADKIVTYLESNKHIVLLPSEQLLQLGRILENEVRFEQALVIYQLYSVQFPLQTEGWVRQASIHTRQNRTLAAIQCLQEAQQLQPNNQDILIELLYMRFDLYANR